MKGRYIYVKKRANYISALLCLVMVLTMLPTTIFAQSNPIGPLEQAARDGEIEVEVVTKEEFIQENANNWGVSYAEAEQRLEPYEESMITPRADPYEEDRVILRKSKALQSGVSLVCKATAYALRDTPTGQYFEFTRVTSANISIDGSAIGGSEWVGGSGSVYPWLASATRLNVDYNGYVEFKVNASFSITFGGVVSLGTSGNFKLYRYDCDGQFAFYVDQLYDYM